MLRISNLPSLTDGVQHLGNRFHVIKEADRAVYFQIISWESGKNSVYVDMGSEHPACQYYGNSVHKV